MNQSWYNFGTEEYGNEMGLLSHFKSGQSAQRSWYRNHKNQNLVNFSVFILQQRH